MKVKITIKTISKQIDIVADNTEGVFTYNGYNVSDDVNLFVNSVKELVEPWEESLINKNVMDGISYTIRVIDGDKKIVRKGQNKLPDNFIKLEQLISGGDAYVK